MRYRAKPLEIEAIQFTGDNWTEINEFAGKHLIDIGVYADSFIPVEEMWVDIPEGIVAVVWVEPSSQWAGVKIGDYIVRDLEGDAYPCEKSVFERKYESVEIASYVSQANPERFRQAIQRSSRYR